MYERSVHVAFISTDIIGIDWLHQTEIKTFLERNLRDKVPSGWCGHTIKINALTGGYDLGIIVPQTLPENQLMHIMIKDLANNADITSSTRMIGLTCTPRCQVCQATYYAIATDCGLCKIVYDLAQAQQVLCDALKQIIRNSNQKEERYVGYRLDHRHR